MDSVDERRACRRRFADSGRATVDDLDRALHGTRTLQLVVAVLLESARRGAQLGGHRSMSASLDYETRDYDDLRRKLVDAARTMKADGWWPTLAEQPQRPRRMRWNLAKELLGSLVRMPDSVTAFYAEIMRRKHDDHVASHSHILNQIGHLFSSSVFIACYGIALFDLPTAMTLGLAALFVRQFGHAVIEPPCHDKEMKLLGFTTRS